MHIVEQVSYKTLGHSRDIPGVRRSIGGWSLAGVLHRLPRLCRQSSWLFDFELSDDLRLALVEDLKIILAKISDGATLRVADHCAHHDQLYVYLECSRLVVRSEFGRVLLSLGLSTGVGRGSLLNIDLLSTDLLNTGLLSTGLSEHRNWANRKPGSAQQRTEEQAAGDKQAFGRTAEGHHPPRFRRTPHENSNRRGKAGHFLIDSPR
jgi:hypothetical protein